MSKVQRLEVGKVKKDSDLFSHFRSIGVVSGGAKARLHTIGGISYISVSIGRCVRTYDVETLNLSFNTPEVEDEIKFIATKDSWMVACSLRKLYLYQRSHFFSSRSIKFPSPLVDMNIFGDNVVFLLEKGMEVRSFPSFDLVHTIEWLGEEHVATCFIHPRDYKNKLLVGFQCGILQLWNISSKKMIYSFSQYLFPGNIEKITSLESSPQVDVVAVGSQDGLLHLFNLREGKVLFSLKHTSPVIHSSFRDDINESAQIATALESGEVFIWDLQQRIVLDTWFAHTATVGTLFFVPQQPILLTTSGDNTIKEWIIERDEAKLLKHRSGHSEAPSLLMFHGEEGSTIISAGNDQLLRSNSLIKDSVSVEISQSKIIEQAQKLKKPLYQCRLPPVTSMATFSANNLKWDNMITAHENSSQAYTWRADHNALGSHILKSSDSSIITAVKISSCGHFAFIGCSTGAIDVYNIQSGVLRRHIAPLNESLVCEIVCDPLGTFIVIIFKSGQVYSLNWRSGHANQLLELSSISFTKDFAEAGLVACVSGNQVNIVDFTTGQVVRVFDCNRAKKRSSVIALDFSSDGKWLITALANCTVQIWDIPSSRLIDEFILHQVPKAMALSPTMEFLAFSMENDISIHLYSNKTLYNPSSVPVGKVIDYRPLAASLTNSIENDIGRLSLDQPRNKFFDLFHIDSIRSRNRPITPVQAPKVAPFFLDALMSSSNQKRQSAPEEVSSLSKEEVVESIVEKSLHEYLSDESITSDFIFTFLARLNISAIDLELKSLSYGGDLSTSSPYLRLLQIICDKLDKGEDLDMVFTVVSLIIRYYPESKIKPKSVEGELFSRIRERTCEQWESIEADFHRALCMANFVKSE